jgi:hypothetical protein
MGNREDYEKNQPEAQGSEHVRDSKHPPPSSQKGPQAHAEGRHGEKTHGRFVEQLHEGKHERVREEQIEEKRHDQAMKGGRRLVEDRQQHDEAEKNSEHTQQYVEQKLDRDHGPSDNTGNIHGILGHREAHSDFEPRDEKGLRRKDKR